MVDKKQVGCVPKLEPIDLSPLYVFISHWYLLYAGAEYLGYDNTRNHVNLMPPTIPALRSLCYSYGDLFASFT